MFSNKVDKRAQEEASNATNTIAKGTLVEGNVETYGNIRIEGKIVGNIKSNSKLVLSDSSVIEGNIYAQNAEIGGEVKGIIEVVEMLVLKPTAQIKGDIITGKLVIESGAIFNGTCKMGASKEVKISAERKEPAIEKTA
jgi:cytoskeletal protein CcmA (bactofilin family)